MMNASLRCPNLALIAVLVVGCSQNSWADDGVLLKAKHRPGDRHYVEVKKTVRQTYGGERLGQNFLSTRINEVMGVFSEVKSVTDDGIAIDLTFDRTGQNINVISNSWKYDSDTSKDADNVIGRPMGVMVGKSVRMMLDNQGRPKSLTGMKPIIEEMDYAAAGHTISAQFLNEFKNVVTDDLMRFQWGDMTANLYPNRKVKVGDTWKSSAEIPGPFSGLSVRNYRFRVDKTEEVDGHMHVSISYQASVENAPDGRTLVDGSGQTIEFISGELTGKATFDAALGYIIHQEEHSKETRLVHMGSKTVPNPSQSQGEVATMVTVVDLEVRRLTVEQREKEKKAP